MKRVLALCTSLLLGFGLATLGVVAPAAADDPPPTDGAAEVVTPEVVVDEPSPETTEPTEPVDPVEPEPEPEPEPDAEPAPETQPEGGDPDPTTPTEPTITEPPTEPTILGEGEPVTEGEEPTEELELIVSQAARVAADEQIVILLANPPNYPVVKKVTFCHATASESNPYVRITTSVNAFFNAGHDTHQNFEDIVPPFSYEKPQGFFDFDGLNYDADAQEFIDNGCSDEVSEVASASVVITPAECGVPEMLILGATEGTNASWGAYTDLEGPLADYEVVSTADDGFLFPDGPGVSDDNTEMTFTGSLAGPLSPDSPECQVVPLVEWTPITCTSAGSFTIGGENVLWKVGGVETAAGTYPVAAATTVQLEATAEEPYSIDPDPTLISLPIPGPQGCPMLAATGADSSGLLSMAALMLLIGTVAVLRDRRRA